MNTAIDNQFQESRIAGVSAESDGGWSIQREDGWSFWVPKDSPVTPAIGMIARFYGRGIGFNVRGLTLDGQVVFYRTPAEEDAKREADNLKREQEKRYDFDKNRADQDRRYRALPDCFQRRIDRFREGCASFRWDYEPYELFCCEQAVAIRNVAMVQAGAAWMRRKTKRTLDKPITGGGELLRPSRPRRHVSRLDQTRRAYESRDGIAGAARGTRQGCGCARGAAD